MVAAASFSSDTDAYRREARRLRARFSSRPGRLHHALKDLATRSDRRPMVTPRVAPLPVVDGSVDAAVERGFSDFVAERLSAGVFTYTDRMRVLRSAERIGLSRFRANLIVALHQHDRPITRPVGPDLTEPRPYWIVPLVVGLELLAAVGFLLLR